MPPPAKRRRRMHSAKLGRSGQAFALDHRPSVVEPTLPFVQMRHRRLGERIEGAPATLAAEPRKPMRASPGDDRSSCAMGTALARHALHGRSSPKHPDDDPAARLVPRPASRGGLRFSRPPEPAVQIRQSRGHFPALLDPQPPNARKPDGNLFSLHRIKLLKPARPSLIHINSYRYKRPFLRERRALMRPAGSRGRVVWDPDHSQPVACIMFFAIARPIYA